MSKNIFGRSLLAATAIGLGLAAAPASAGLFNPETFVLDNGMRVIVVTNRRAPVVSHWVWYMVGGADSPVGKSGLPHYLEHLMFKGTETIPPGEFSKIVARNGGSDNAQTSPDYTAYFQNIARDRLEMVMEMEADRMTNLVMSEEQAIAERSVIIEERQSRVDNDPGARLGEQMNAVQYLNHPYQDPIIGWRHEIESYTREDALAFYDEWYAPNNAVLIVAGDVDMAELRPLAERIYGAIPAREVRTRQRVDEPPQEAPRQVTLADPRVVQPSFIRSYLAPSQRQIGWQKAMAMDLFAEVLGGGNTSRLYRELVVDKAMATGAGSFYRGSSFDETTFRIYASPRAGGDLGELEQAVDEVLDRALKEGVTEEEVERIKKRLRASAIYARDSLSGSIRVIGRALAAGLEIEDVEEWPERLEKITADMVNETARELIQPGASVTGYLKTAEAPANGVEAHGEEG
ncbi:MAG: M16 family metallopeptidase [Geminicoccaceae bacterium]